MIILQDLNQMTNESVESAKEKGRSMQNMGHRANQVVKKATRGVRQKAKEGLKAAGKKMAKAAVKLIKAIGQLIAKLVAAAPVAVAVILVVAIVLGFTYTWFCEDRGTSQNKALSSSAENPAHIDKETGALTAVGLTEPQAILDAYYKYMACQSYVKEFGNTQLTFRGQTEDFAGLTDYYGAEGDYYLSPELIMMADEVLHQGDFRWPEHIIAPVSHKTVEYTDVAGNVRRVVETQPLRTDGIADKSVIQSTGLGSVLQYEPGVKDDYVSAKVTKFQVDYDLVIPAAEPGEEESYQHLVLKTFTVSENDTATSLRNKITAYQQTLTGIHVTEGSGRYITYDGPSDTMLGQFVGSSNISRTSNGVTTSFTIDHMPQEVLGRDMEVDKTSFNDPALKSTFGNNANGLYPIKLALVSSAATFSGNIRYNYISEPIATALQDGTSTHLYDPVDKFSYTVSCSVTGDRVAKATKTGRHITVCPVVASKNPDPSNLGYSREDHDVETGNPWAYDYFDAYVNNYSAIVPPEVYDDPDFYERAADEETLDMLRELGLLSDSGSNMNAIGSYSDEDLMIVARLIKHEAGSNKLDELMVGAVFVNRIAHPSFPNTAQEVLMQPGQYGVDKNGVPHVNWDAITPSESNIDSARKVLSGEFSIPSNVVFQAAFLQGQGTYLINVNSATGGAHEYTHYYCWYGSSLSTVDRFGRTALTANSARALADQLAGGAAADTPANNVSYSSEKLYDTVGFNVVAATNMLHKIANPKQEFLGTFADWFSSAGDFFTKMQDKDRFFATYGELNASDGTLYNYTPEETDQRRIIYQAVTFRDSVRYSDVVTDWEGRREQFLFLGDKADGSEISIISYVGSVLPGWCSPTAIPSTPVSTEAGTSGKGAIMSTLEGETLQALYQGQVISVTGNSVKIRYEQISGLTYVSTYSGLSEVLVTMNTYVKQGDTVGKAGNYQGAPGFLFEFYCETTGAYESPMAFFYQAVYSGGGSDVVSVALAEAAAYKANPVSFDKLKYERWMHGSSCGESWCADFVSWCGWQVYPNSRWPKTAGAGWMKQMAEQQGVFEPSQAYGGSYTPQPGDVIFYIWDNSGALICSHVGLVVGVEGNSVITVEGNTSKPQNEPVLVSGNGVWRKAHDLSNHEIIGYGRFTTLVTSES